MGIAFAAFYARRVSGITFIRYVHTRQTIGLQMYSKTTTTTKKQKNKNKTNNSPKIPYSCNNKLDIHICII
jgi:hypothetical protein